MCRKDIFLFTCKERIWAFWLGIILPEKVHGERGGRGLKGNFTAVSATTRCVLAFRLRCASCGPAACILVLGFIAVVNDQENMG